MNTAVLNIFILILHVVRIVYLFGLQNVSARFYLWSSDVAGFKSAACCERLTILAIPRDSLIRFEQLIINYTLLILPNTEKKLRTVDIWLSGRC